MSVYIHVPFCSHICSYCDFCKLLKNDKWIDDYLNSLELEIRNNYKFEKVDTLYIGGGTPSSLSLNQLERLFEILEIFDLDGEVTFEANSEDLNISKLEFLSKRVNRLSIGVQTFDEKRLKDLNRGLNITNLKSAFNYFKNINIDLMYGFKNQNISELEDDLDKIIKLNPSHISTYSLIIEDNTILKINDYQRLDDDTDGEMYDLIKSKLEKNGYIHYEISNFAKSGFFSNHNLTYWNNEEYYGFGLGASGYLNGVRYENTRSLTKYLKGDYIKDSYRLSLDERLQNELMLGFRKISGIDKKSFKKKYKIDIEDILKIRELTDSNYLINGEESIYINPKYIYTSNEILIKLIDITL